ncbi:hypothetical protein BDQ17DRAFT_1332847 [Cyathus striatus]|nr:hypothetical protein BDQ17DRAFT_1332847 [Cyathus striatus]
MPTCPETQNTLEVDQTKFWDSNGVNWDGHRIGWVIAGACSVAVRYHFFRARTKNRTRRQYEGTTTIPRNNDRSVYAIIYFSYRFFRDYTYYSLIEVSYEAVTLSAFLLLIIEYVAITAEGHSAEKAIERKDKRPLPLPVYFMYTVKWSVLQWLLYVLVFDLVSISVALYGLVIFYGLTAEELKERRSLAKFLAFKLIVMFAFYQSFVSGGVGVRGRGRACGWVRGRWTFAVGSAEASGGGSLTAAAHVSKLSKSLSLRGMKALIVVMHSLAICAGASWELELSSFCSTRVSYTAGDGVRQRGTLGVPARVLSSLLSRGKSTSDVGHFLSQLRVASFGVRCYSSFAAPPRVEYIRYVLFPRAVRMNGCGASFLHRAGVGGDLGVLFALLDVMSTLLRVKTDHNHAIVTGS